MYKFLPELIFWGVCRWCDKTFWCFFPVYSFHCRSLTKCER